jgi:hypothetical protein
MIFQLIGLSAVALAVHCRLIVDKSLQADHFDKIGPPLAASVHHESIIWRSIMLS